MCTNKVLFVYEKGVKSTSSCTKKVLFVYQKSFTSCEAPDTPTL